MKIEQPKFYVKEHGIKSLTFSNNFVFLKLRKWKNKVELINCYAV
jgi:hypothetical protein